MSSLSGTFPSGVPEAGLSFPVWPALGAAFGKAVKRTGIICGIFAAAMVVDPLSVYTPNTVNAVRPVLGELAFDRAIHSRCVTQDWGLHIESAKNTAVKNALFRKLLDDLPAYDKKILFSRPLEIWLVPDLKALAKQKNIPLEGTPAGDGATGVTFNSTKRTVIVLNLYDGHHLLLDDLTLVRSLGHEIGHNINWTTLDNFTYGSSASIGQSAIEKAYENDLAHLIGEENSGLQGDDLMKKITEKMPALIEKSEKDKTNPLRFYKYFIPGAGVHNTIQSALGEAFPEIYGRVLFPDYISRHGQDITDLFPGTYAAVKQLHEKFLTYQVPTCAESEFENSLSGHPEQFMFS